MIKYYSLDKIDFQRLIKNNGDVLRYEYVKNGNDEFNPCGTMKKQATYELYAVFIDSKKMIVYKNHRRDHFTVENEVIKKYKKWELK